MESNESEKTDKKQTVKSITATQVHMGCEECIKLPAGEPNQSVFNESTLRNPTSVHMSKEEDD